MAYNQFPEHPDDSVGSWMLTLFVAGIPLVGFIYLLVLALGSGGSPSKRNFARPVHLADHRHRRDDPDVRPLWWCDHGGAAEQRLLTAILTRRVVPGHLGATLFLWERNSNVSDDS